MVLFSSLFLIHFLHISRPFVTLFLGKYCFMVQDTLQALEMSSVETIIVWENLTINRLTVKNTSTGEEKILHLDPDQEKNDAHFHDPVTGVQLEIVDRLTLVRTCGFIYLWFIVIG